MEDPIKKLILQLNVFSQLDHKMQLSTVLTFLEIASAEADERELLFRDVQNRIGMKAGPTSRNVHYWAEGHKEMKGGYEMITIKENPNKRTQRILSLTPKGERMVRLIAGEKDGSKTG